MKMENPVHVEQWFYPPANPWIRNWVRQQEQRPLQLIGQLNGLGSVTLSNLEGIIQECSEENHQNREHLCFLFFLFLNGTITIQQVFEGMHNQLPGLQQNDDGYNELRNQYNIFSDQQRNDHICDCLEVLVARILDERGVGQ